MGLFLYLTPRAALSKYQQLLLEPGSRTLQVECERREGNRTGSTSLRKIDQVRKKVCSRQLSTVSFKNSCNQHPILLSQAEPSPVQHPVPQSLSFEWELSIQQSSVLSFCSFFFFTMMYVFLKYSENIITIFFQSIH